ncbi:hypothetical protein LguiA_030768 [Lonicera macranthoides]
MSSIVSHLIYTNPLLLILFVALLLNVTLAITNNRGNETDSLALLAFKSNLHDPRGVLNSWNSSVHFCKWQGITCGLWDRRVMVLNLRSSGLVGSLSPNIGNLSFLRHIVLHNNSLQGQIPPQIGCLFRLKSLLLTNNSLEGKIPANLSHCTSVMQLRVANIKLVEEIPRELTTLSNLILLSVSRNYLRGEIWNCFGNLNSLKELSLSYNALEGSIPDTFGQVIKLRFLRIAVNEISDMLRELVELESTKNNGQDEPCIINLHQRINIAMDVACALEYLHYQCKKPIGHYDLKPTNILLDRYVVAHLGDFGLVKFLVPKLLNANQCSSIGIRGIIGYIALGKHKSSPLLYFGIR